VAALAADNVFYSEPFGLGIHLGVQALHHLVGGEHAEVSTLGGISAPGVVESDLMEKHQVPHESVGPGVCENVARRGDKKNFGPLAVESRLAPDPVYSLDFIYEKFDHVLKGVRLNPEVVSVIVAVGHGADDPVDIEADEVQEFTAHHRYLCRIDPVRAEKRAAAAFRALKKVHEPLFQDIFGKFACPDHFAHEFAGKREVLAVD